MKRTLAVFVLLATISPILAQEKQEVAVLAALVQQRIENLVPQDLSEWNPSAAVPYLVQVPGDSILIELTWQGRTWGRLDYRYSEVTSTLGLNTMSACDNRADCGKSAVDGCERNGCKVNDYNIRKNADGEAYCSFDCRGGGNCGNIIGSTFCIEREPPPTVPVTGIQDSPDPYGNTCGDWLCLEGLPR